MKRFIALLLASLFLLGGCSQKETIESPVVFYFIPAEPLTETDLHHGISFLRAEVRDGSHMGTALAQILTAYLRGPNASSGLKSPFPKGCYLYNVKQEDSTLILTMAGTFAELTDLDLTIACACLAQTCIGLTGVETVQIQAKDALLDGNAFIYMDMEMLELLDQYQKGSE